ncbi:MAG: ModD protein [Eggerthellaceae bacterium]|nr:ModD protein [Eggerthellaceae bacterium]
MIRIPDSRLDYFVSEDVPYIDLTTTMLGIGETRGEMEYFTRERCVVAGVEEVARIARNLGCEVEPLYRTGDRIDPEGIIMRVNGSAAQLHQVWKVGLNILDHLSAVATKTRKMVRAVQAANPLCEVLTTRKSMPGCKDLLTEAIVAGGAYPHRLGLSETVLVFEQHWEFMGGFDSFVDQLPRIRHRCLEKKLFVEANAQQARVLADAGVDGIQFDKLSPEQLETLVPELRDINPRVTLVAAGGINPDNAAEYAATGIDGLVTTSLFTAKPLDMSARMFALD